MVLVQGPLPRDGRTGTVLFHSVLSLYIASIVTMQTHVRIHYPSTLPVMLPWPFFCPHLAEVNFLGTRCLHGVHGGGVTDSFRLQ